MNSPKAESPPKPWPVFASLQGYDGCGSADVIPGLTVWAVLVPEALAYATIAGAPPVSRPHGAALANLYKSPSAS